MKGNSRYFCQITRYDDISRALNSLWNVRFERKITNTAELFFHWILCTRHYQLMSQTFYTRIRYWFRCYIFVRWKHFFLLRNSIAENVLMDKNCFGRQWNACQWLEQNILLTQNNNQREIMRLLVVTTSNHLHDQVRLTMVNWLSFQLPC